MNSFCGILTPLDYGHDKLHVRQEYLNMIDTPRRQIYPTCHERVYFKIQIGWSFISYPGKFIGWGLRYVKVVANWFVSQNKISLQSQKVEFTKRGIMNLKRAKTTFTEISSIFVNIMDKWDQIILISES